MRALRRAATCAERGLGEGVLRRFGVGYAPSAWDQVLLRGQRAGFGVAELRGVGLVQRGRGGGEYDRFRSRIMFPIRDRRGRVLGFGGRAMRSDQGAKYVNTAETDFFHKSRMLYGIDVAKAAIAKEGHAIVVEGYTDVLALHQAGIEEAVGVMGTAMTDEQVAALSGMVEEVVLALDADSAGQEAMLRVRAGGGRTQGAPACGCDARRRGPRRADRRPGTARSAFGLWSRARSILPPSRLGSCSDRADVLSPLERDRALSEVAPILGGMGETASREELLRRVAERLELEPAMVMGRVVAARPASGAGADLGPQRRRSPGVSRRETAELTSRERRERALLAMCIALPSAGAEYLARLSAQHLSPLGARAAAWLREHPPQSASDLPRDDDELAGLIAELTILAHDEPASAEAMELNFMLLEQRRLESEISAAGERGDYAGRAALSRERATLVERIARTERVEG